MIMSTERKQLEPEDFLFEQVSSTASQGLGHPDLQGAPLSASPPNSNVLNIREAKERVERELIGEALKKTDGNKSGAAKLLGITREGLRKAMKKCA